jgi:hypothetical protein
MIVIPTHFCHSDSEARQGTPAHNLKVARAGQVWVCRKPDYPRHSGGGRNLASKKAFFCIRAPCTFSFFFSKTI